MNESIRIEKERKFWDKLKWESNAEIEVIKSMKKLPAVNASFKELYRGPLRQAHNQRGSERQ